MAESKFAREVTKAFVGQLRTARQAAEMTQVEVVNELGRYGLKMDPSAYARIERGARGISLVEATALSRILHIAPRSFEPIPEDVETELLEGAFSQAERVTNVVRKLQALSVECRSIVSNMESISRGSVDAGDAVGPTTRRTLDDMVGEDGRNALREAADTLDGVVATVGPYGTEYPLLADGEVRRGL